MKRVFRIAVFFAAVFAFSAGGAFAAEAQRIGFVDLQKVLNMSAAGKAAKEQLAEKVKKYQEEINRRQDDLKKLKDLLEKQSVAMSEKARSDKEKEYQQNLKEFQRLTKDAQEDLQAKDEELTKSILGQIERVVQDFGKKNGFTLIFIRNESMLYADDKADVTDSILKIFNTTGK